MTGQRWRRSGDAVEAGAVIHKDENLNQVKAVRTAKGQTQKYVRGRAGRNHYTLGKGGVRNPQVNVCWLKEVFRHLCPNASRACCWQPSPVLYSQAHGNHHFSLHCHPKENIPSCLHTGLSAWWCTCWPNCSETPPNYSQRQPRIPLLPQAGALSKACSSDNRSSL